MSWVKLLLGGVIDGIAMCAALYLWFWAISASKDCDERGLVLKISGGVSITCVQTLAPDRK